MSLKLMIEILGVTGLTALSLSGPALAHDFNRSHGWQNGWGQGQMMGQGYMMDQGHMMAPGYMMNPGHMMGQGYMTGPGYMMGPGFNQPGGAGPGIMPSLREDLDIGDVRHMMEHRLRWMNNPNLKLGNIDEKDADTITADIVTKDGSLVQRLNVNRHTGWMEPGQ